VLSGKVGRFFALQKILYDLDSTGILKGKWKKGFIKA